MTNDRTYGPLRQTLAELQMNFQPHVVSGLAGHIAACLKGDLSAFDRRTYGLSGLITLEQLRSGGQPQFVRDLADHVYELLSAHQDEHDAAEEAAVTAMSLPLAEEDKTTLAEHDAETSPGTEVDALQVAIAHAREAAKEEVQLQDDGEVEPEASSENESTG